MSEYLRIKARMPVLPGPAIQATCDRLRREAGALERRDIDVQPATGGLWILVVNLAGESTPEERVRIVTALLAFNDITPEGHHLNYQMSWESIDKHNADIAAQAKLRSRAVREQVSELAYEMLPVDLRWMIKRLSFYLRTKEDNR